MNYVIDDIGIKYKDYLWKLDKVKKENPDFKITAFVIAKGLTPEIIEWLKQDWIEVGVHCWDHSAPPEGECDNFEERTEKAFKKLGPLLNKVIYRFAGFQAVAKCYSILEQFEVEAIVHFHKIQLLRERKTIEVDLINKHIYENRFDIPKGKFQFISELF